MRLERDDPLATDVTRAIKTGDMAWLERLLREHPGLASARIARDESRSRTVLHQAADWPGFFPNGAAIVRMLIAAGADVNAAGEGDFPETPLHWAASSDDLEVADALLEAGADLEVAGGSIGTPLDNAVGYGCWQVARRLVERGARVDKLWHAAALGMTARVEAFFEATPQPTSEEISAAFWQACSGAQRRTAEYLLKRGADINFVPYYAKVTPLEAAGGLDTRRGTIVTWLQEQGAERSSSG